MNSKYGLCVVAAALVADRGARMPVHANVVVVEHMRRHPVDQRGIGRCEVAPARNFRRAVSGRGGRHDLLHQLHGLFVGTRDHRADAIEHADARTVRFCRTVSRIGMST